MKIYQVDAFTDKLFSGNPAAICPLSEWLTDEQMLNIAMENNLSETAFFVPQGDEYELRWFTPRAEVKLCGHATLASSFVIFEILKTQQQSLNFKTLSGTLTVRKTGKGFTMNFPSDIFMMTAVTEEMERSIGLRPDLAYLGHDVLMLVLNSEKELVGISPDYSKLTILHKHGVIVTAPGDQSDFVSRCFFPHYGVPEDPVTGSAHTILTPYWSDRLKKTKLHARQLSSRKGELICTNLGKRVEIYGEAVLYMIGELFV